MGLGRLSLQDPWQLLFVVYVPLGEPSSLHGVHSSHPDVHFLRPEELRLSPGEPCLGSEVLRLSLGELHPGAEELWPGLGDMRLRLAELFPHPAEQPLSHEHEILLSVGIV